jgi:hypothetical protein
MFPQTGHFVQGLPVFSSFKAKFLVAADSLRSTASLSCSPLNFKTLPNSDLPKFSKFCHMLPTEHTIQPFPPRRCTLPQIHTINFTRFRFLIAASRGDGDEGFSRDPCTEVTELCDF